MLSSIPVNYIRQWAYCPRIVYYMELTDFSVTYPTWVRQGEKFHEKEARLWQRRNLSRFGLENGKVHLNFHVQSENLGIHGIVDMLVETEDALYPIEFKLAYSSKMSGGILQLTAYALLVNEVLCKKCETGFFIEGEKKLHRIAIDKSLIGETRESISAIRNMLSCGMKPDSSASISQCTNCEYLNHCNDRG